jgi:hypothetical protein
MSIPCLEVLIIVQCVQDAYVPVMRIEFSGISVCFYLVQFLYIITLIICKRMPIVFFFDFAVFSVPLHAPHVFVFVEYEG